MQIVDSPYILWKPPLEKPSLTVDKIHVWCASLQRSPSEIEELRAILSPDEKNRASKFHFPQHQRRFTVARGILRKLLADYLNLNPQNIRFNYLERGKPELVGDRCLQFNVSHSEELALYAIGLTSPVGVDVEFLRPSPDIEQIAARFFTKREYEELRSLPPLDKTVAFFRCWTRKEAYLKACGDGLGGGLDSIEVSLTPEAQISRINGSKDSSNWTMYSSIPAEGYVGAIACAARSASIDCWNLI